MRYTTAQRDALLYIALISMFCDHAAYLFPAVQEGLHSIGRIAFPIFAWSFGYVLATKTEFPTMQLYRLMITGGISQILWDIYQPGFINIHNIFLRL